MKEPFKWVDYDTWRFWKNGYKTDIQIAMERMQKYLKEHPGVREQLEWVESHPGEALPLTEEMLNEFIDSLRVKDIVKKEIESL